MGLQCVLALRDGYVGNVRCANPVHRVVLLPLHPDELELVAV